MLINFILVKTTQLTLPISEEKCDKQDSIPQLFIDVHLDDKSIHRLTIYEGDSPQSLANEFCIKHGRNPHTVLF